ncbi:spore wall protein 2-like [Vigna radiata var. radiata]|uniref:Spore wall protein 2-like n=1 Tax=Vigna radiata var. radiata TaxID=3916 RepID=A0A1S3TVF4_VIGRR|nr:spore wall protein 2-like [Vigna radiata var. radiata]
MDVKELWYSLRGQSVDPHRLELLTDDRGVMHMLSIARLNDEVHLYVVHNMMEPEIIEMIDLVGGHLDDEGDVATQVEEVEVVGDGEVQTEMVEGEGEGEGEGDGEVHTEVETEMVEGEGDAHEGDGEVHTELGKEMVEGEGDAHEDDGEVHTELGTKMVEGEGNAHEGDVEFHTEVGIEIVEGEGDAHEGDGDDGEVHQVEDGEVHHVGEAEVHEVHDFELEDLGEDDDVEDNEGEDVHEAETEDKDVDDEEVDVSEESLIDVSVQCDIGTSKENVRQEPSSPVVESSWSTDNVCIHDVRGLSNNEWLLEELISEADSEDDDGSTKIRFPTFSMPKSLEAYKWEVRTYFTEKKGIHRCH